MLVDIKLNGKSVKADVACDMTLYDFVREHGCYSVKCGCETSNCGLCTVFLNDKPVLSCSVLAINEQINAALQRLKVYRRRPQNSLHL